MANTEIETQFVDLADRHQQTIYKVCFVYASDNELLKDLYQEVILNLWKAFPRFRGECNETTWVYRIAMNTCITYIRKSSSRPKTIPLSVNIDCLMEDDDERAPQLRTLYLLISKLEKLERAIILLYLEDKSYEEIAEITGLTATNVGVKLSRIREKLRRMSNH